MYRIAVVLSLVLWIAPAIALADDAPAPGKSVSVEVVIADVASDVLLEDASNEVSADQIRDLEKHGKLNALVRVRLATIENRLATAQFGERLPMATGRVSQRGFGGGESPGAVSYAMQNVGTIVETTPHVEADGSVLLELQVERTHLDSPPPSDDADNASDSFTPPQSRTLSVRTSLRVPPGKTVVISGQETLPKKTRRTYVLISANVLAGN